MNLSQQARARYRQGLVSPTAGHAPGLTQCNMISLPRAMFITDITDIPDSHYHV